MHAKASVKQELKKKNLEDALCGSKGSYLDIFKFVTSNDSLVVVDYNKDV